jgi:hypothetical protein
MEVHTWEGCLQCKDNIMSVNLNVWVQLRDGSTHLGTVPSMEPNEDVVLFGQVCFLHEYLDRSMNHDNYTFPVRRLGLHQRTARIILITRFQSED